MSVTFFNLKLSLILLLPAFSLLSQNADVKILQTINAHNRPAWDAAMRHTSFSAYPVGIISPFAVWSHGYFSKSRELKNNGYKCAITTVSALLISTSLKLTVQRERPYAAYPMLITRRDTTAGPHSFPSGHTTAAFATATGISLSYNKWYVTVPAYLYAGMVAYSRMRLGVHYPTDLLGGIVLGVGSGMLTWKVDKMIRVKKEKRREALQGS